MHKMEMLVDKLLRSVYSGVKAHDIDCQSQDFYPPQARLVRLSRSAGRPRPHSPSRDGRIVSIPPAAIGIHTNAFSRKFTPIKIVGAPISGIFRLIPGHSSDRQIIVPRPRKSTQAPVDPTFHPQSKSNLIRPNQTLDFFFRRPKRHLTRWALVRS
jgi:hypothetical protein